MELQTSAACSVNMCNVKNINVEYCIKTPSNPTMRQNYYLLSPPQGEEGILGLKGIKMAINSWQSWKSLKSMKYNDSTKHHNQVNSRDTKYVGCAGVVVGDKVLFGCHYSPENSIWRKVLFATEFFCKL